MCALKELDRFFFLNLAILSIIHTRVYHHFYYITKHTGSVADGELLLIKHLL